MGPEPGQGAMPVEDTLIGGPDYTAEDDSDGEELCVYCGKIVNLDEHGWSAVRDGVACSTCAINDRVTAMAAAGAIDNQQARRNIIQAMLAATQIANAVEQGGQTRAEGWTGNMFQIGEDVEAHDPGASSSGDHQEVD